MRNILAIIVIAAFVFSTVGCEAFVRKFTRKPKKDRMPQEEMVVVPQEYNTPQLTKEEQFRNYFFYWKSWQDELIEALLDTNQKKQVRCIDEAVKNLRELLPLLNADGQKVLNASLEKMNQLRGVLENDTYATQRALHRVTAETIKRNILKEFSAVKLKGYLS
jgi:hypothetical protein